MKKMANFITGFVPRELRTIGKSSVGIVIGAIVAAIFPAIGGIIIAVAVAGLVLKTGDNVVLSMPDKNGYKRSESVESEEQL